VFKGQVAKHLIAIGIAVFVVCAGLLGWIRSRMTSHIAPNMSDLEEAYRHQDPNLVGHQSADAVVAVADGITVLCNTDANGAGDRAWVVDLDLSGGVRWQHTFPEGQGTFGTALAASPDGGYVVAGNVQRSEMEFQGLVLRLGADGSKRGGAAYGPRGVTGFSAAAVLADGSIVAGGDVHGKGWLVRFDGALQATAERSLADMEGITGLAPLPDGGFALVGFEEKSTAGLGMARLAVFGIDGRERWHKRLPADRRGELRAVTALADGGLVGGGYTRLADQNRSRLWAIRFNDGGGVAWERLLGTANEETRAFAVTAFADGGVALAGHAVGADLDHRSIVVVRLGPDGAPRWERKFGGGRMDVARGMTRIADGGVVVVGSTQSRGPGKTNAWILRLDADGQLLWEKVLGAPVPGLR
jgi:hypothetical protein